MENLVVQPSKSTYPPSFKQPLPSPKKVHLPLKKLLHLYAEMIRIRKAEEKIVELYPQQEIRCPTHLSIGQEAAPVGIVASLTLEDHVYSGHRCHAHYLAKGGTLEEMFAELYGKSTGCAKGFGGSMHLVAPRVGMMGSSALVGGTIPLAVGSALAFKMKKKSLVAVSFFGDAGVEEGVFYESYLFSVLQALPVLFVCENNYYATNTPLYKRQPKSSITNRIKGLGGFALAVDGNNVLAVYQAARKAVENARRGKGPTFLECHTYRWREHVGYNFDYHLGYRAKKEVDQWINYCPIKNYKKWLLKHRLVSELELNKIDEKVDQEVSLAVQKAKEAPLPDIKSLNQYVYA